jgi:hypothetical protein
MSMPAVRRFPRLDTQTHEERGEHDENVRLQECNKELEKIDADDERDRSEGNKI